MLCKGVGECGEFVCRVCVDFMWRMVGHGHAHLFSTHIVHHMHTYTPHAHIHTIHTHHIHTLTIYTHSPYTHTHHIHTGTIYTHSPYTHTHHTRTSHINTGGWLDSQCSNAHDCRKQYQHAHAGTAISTAGSTGCKCEYTGREDQ